MRGILEVKTCSKCKEEKPLTEFYKKKDAPDGLQYRCKECSKAGASEWNKANKDRHYQSQRRWREKYPDKHRANARRWQINNPDKVRFKEKRRKSLLRRAEGSFDLEDIEYLLEHTDRCFCGAEINRDNYTIEHIIPISRGGTHHLYNLMLLCGTCNSSKNNKIPVEYIQYLGPEKSVTYRAAIENRLRIGYHRESVYQRDPET